MNYENDGEWAMKEWEDLRLGLKVRLYETGLKLPITSNTSLELRLYVHNISSVCVDICSVVRI